MCIVPSVLQYLFTRHDNRVSFHARYGHAGIALIDLEVLENASIVNSPVLLERRLLVYFYSSWAQQLQWRTSLIDLLYQYIRSHNILITETHRIQVAMKAWEIERPLYSLASHFYTLPLESKRRR